MAILHTKQKPSRNGWDISLYFWTYSTSPLLYDDSSVSQSGSRDPKGGRKVFSWG